MADTTFKLTYATMFNPPEELHTRFEEALTAVKGNLGKEHGMIINGEERFAEEKFEDRSPVSTDMVLGVFQKGTAEDAGEAIAANFSPAPGADMCGPTAAINSSSRAARLSSCVRAWSSRRIRMLEKPSTMAR